MSKASTGLSRHETRTVSAVRPRYVSIATWCDITNLGRTTTYYLMAQKQLRTIKVRGKRLVDLDQGLEMLDKLPIAETFAGLGVAPKRPR